MKKILLIKILFLALFCGNLQAEVNEIKVWSPDFKTINTITNQNQIQLIVKYWSEAEIKQKSSENPLKHEKLYKIDFKGNSKVISGRWLYSKSGYYKYLSKAPQKIYKVNNVSKLNEQLGI